MSWAQITFSRFAISVWQQERGSARQGTGQSCPCAERPDTTGDPCAKGASRGGTHPLPHCHPSSHRCHLVPRAAAQLQAAETPREGPGKLIPNTTPTKNISPASSIPTLRAPGWLLPPPCQQHGAPRPLAPRATLPQPGRVPSAQPPTGTTTANRGSPGRRKPWRAALLTAAVFLQHSSAKGNQEQRGEGEQQPAGLPLHPPPGPAWPHAARPGQGDSTGIKAPLAPQTHPWGKPQAAGSGPSQGTSG